MARDETDVNASPSSVTEEIVLLRKDFRQVSIIAATPSFVTASYGRTPFTRIKVTVTFPDNYPDHPLIVAVASDNFVPPGLKKKLENDLGKLASDLTGQHEQVCAVFHRLVNFVDTNRFVPCWRELKQCVDLVGAKGKGSPAASKSTIGVLETKGKIKIQFRHKKYFYGCSIVIDEGYPSTKTHMDYGQACKLTMDSTNFPPRIEQQLTSQGKELVRRMQDGMAAEEALEMSNPIRPPNDAKVGKEPPKTRLTRDTLKSLKKDTETLSTVRDLREVNSATVQGNARVKAHHAKERKDARRAISKLTEKEIGEDRAREEKEKQWQAEEQARMVGYSFTEYDGSNPQPSLLALVTFLHREVHRLPDVRCPVCENPTLPKEPDELKALYQSAKDAKTDKEKRARRDAKAKRPTRTYCGCWYHYSCLHKFMTEPPFGAECNSEGCGRRVYHPDWPGDMKVLEREWASQQARKREIEDAAMFL